MSKRGHAKVRPDGRVAMQIVVGEDVYHLIRRFADRWGMTASEVVEDIINQQAVFTAPKEGS